ncbi:restriction endonuclease subunit S [Xanthobacter autotrophicus]|uniref:restriction endonuclease subunit S n=1 Tax=Xanthobacter autotrophicus TaxID=280 RepID=UPI003727A3CE
MRGKLPKGWEVLELDEIAFVQTGIAINGEPDRLNPVRLPYLRVANVQDGHIDLSEIKHITVSGHQVARYALQEGDVLMTEGGDFDKLGRGAVWRGQLAPCLHQNHVFAVRPDQTRIVSAFLAAYCESAAGKRYFLSCSKQTTNLASINSTQLKEMPVVVPPLPEQQLMVAALDAWDEAIDQTERLIAAKQRRFDATRIRLIETFQSAGKDRNLWVPAEFGEIAEELKQRNAAGHGPDRVMGVIKGEGLVPMRSHVMAADLRRYLIVPSRAIAYNPMRLNIGSIAASRYDQDVLVSPDYVVFRARKGRADPDFLRFLIGTKRWRDHLITVGSGSVRTRIYFDGLAEMVLRVPDIREQKRIGQILAAMEQDLSTTIEAASALRTQKRGLMQKLLTGEWRLNGRFDPVPAPHPLHAGDAV